MQAASSSGDHVKFVPTLASTAVLAGLALSVTPALAIVDAARTLSIASQNACMDCRAVDRRLIGPAYQGVTAKYKGSADAQTKLIKKIHEGGMDNWDQIPMPANLEIADTGLKTAVDWVLAGAPAR